MTTSMQYLANNLQRTLKYADSLAADIPADRFTHKPHPKINHPAWCYGHLALYPDRMLPLIGREDLAQSIDDYAALFAAGTDPVDDPARYPGKDAILDRFRSRHAVVLSLLPEISDAVLENPNPNPRMAERFPKVGHTLHFMFANHMMMHLGQVSSWRRCIGLGPVK